MSLNIGSHSSSHACMRCSLGLPLQVCSSAWKIAPLAVLFFASPVGYINAGLASTEQTHKELSYSNMNNKKYRQFVSCMEERGVAKFNPDDRYAPIKINVSGALFDLAKEKYGFGYETFIPPKGQYKITKKDLEEEPRIKALVYQSTLLIGDSFKRELDFRSLEVKITGSSSTYPQFHLDSTSEGNVSYVDAIMTVDSEDIPSWVLSKDEIECAQTTMYVPGLIGAQEPFKETNMLFGVEESAFFDCSHEFLPYGLASYARYVDTNELLLVDFNFHTVPVRESHILSSTSKRWFARFHFSA